MGDGRGLADDAVKNSCKQRRKIMVGRADAVRGHCSFALPSRVSVRVAGNARTRAPKQRVATELSRNTPRNFPRNTAKNDDANT